MTHMATKIGAICPIKFQMLFRAMIRCEVGSGACATVWDDRVSPPFLRNETVSAATLLVIVGWDIEVGGNLNILFASPVPNKQQLLQRRSPFVASSCSKYRSISHSGILQPMTAAILLGRSEKKNAHGKPDRMHL